MDWEDKIYRVNVLEREYEVIDPSTLSSYDATHLSTKGFCFSIKKYLYIQPRNLNNVNMSELTQSGRAYLYIKEIMIKKEKLDNYIKLI